MEPIRELHRPGRPAPTSARVDVTRLLAGLSSHQRAALYLSSIEGMSDREAALALGMRPATVRVHRHRALKRLRQLAREES